MPKIHMTPETLIKLSNIAQQKGFTPAEYAEYLVAEQKLDHTIAEFLKQEPWYARNLEEFKQNAVRHEIERLVGQGYKFN
jgi:hypothetical protein